MGIKKIIFPTFKEWNETKTEQNERRDYRTNLGDYHIHIRADSWGNNYSNYALAISTSANPLNIYSEKIMHRDYKHYSEDDLTRLENWFNSVTAEANDVFAAYITKEYYCEDLSTTDNVDRKIDNIPSEDGIPNGRNIVRV